MKQLHFFRRGLPTEQRCIKNICELSQFLRIKGERVAKSYHIVTGKKACMKQPICECNAEVREGCI